MWLLKGLHNYPLGDRKTIEDTEQWYIHKRIRLILVTVQHHFTGTLHLEPYPPFSSPQKMPPTSQEAPGNLLD